MIRKIHLIYKIHLCIKWIVLAQLVHGFKSYLGETKDQISKSFLQRPTGETFK